MKKEKKDTPNFPLTGDNYKIIGIGVIVLIIGYFLMSGGGTDNPKEFSEALFSFTRVTLSPLLILAAFIVIGWGIMKKPIE